MIQGDYYLPPRLAHVQLTDSSLTDLEDSVAFGDRLTEDERGAVLALVYLAIHPEAVNVDGEGELEEARAEVAELESQVNQLEGHMDALKLRITELEAELDAAWAETETAAQ